MTTRAALLPNGGGTTRGRLPRETAHAKPQREAHPRACQMLWVYRSGQCSFCTSFFNHLSRASRRGKGLLVSLHCTTYTYPVHSLEQEAGGFSVSCMPCRECAHGSSDEELHSAASQPDEATPSSGGCDAQYWVLGSVHRRESFLGMIIACIWLHSRQYNALSTICFVRTSGKPQGSPQMWDCCIMHVSVRSMLLEMPTAACSAGGSPCSCSNRVCCPQAGVGAGARAGWRRRRR